MAPKKASPTFQSPVAIPIGNCEVMVDAKKFTCKSDDPNTLQIFISRTAKINISVKEEINLKPSDCNCQSKSEENGDDCMFVLVNPKDADSNGKSYLQEVLKIYTRELPTMNYAANTGKQSMFLEKCVCNGKYCTLLLKSKSTQVIGEVVAAITYQIVPADTQYAEVPLAAVSSIYQHKGFGHLLYMELRKRLQNVGIRTIFCWGDKESEGFWLKQGFVPIAQVDTKGRARRLPIKADIRRALCFPGGSTLMVSHLSKDTSANSADPLKFCFPRRPCNTSPLVIFNRSVEPGFIGDYDKSPKSLNQITSGTKSYQPEQLLEDRFPEEATKFGTFFPSLDSIYGCGEPATSEKVQCSNHVAAAKIGADTDAKHCSCSAQGAKRRVWEASLSSLKSKKVKGSHHVDCELDSNCGFVSEGDETFGNSGIEPWMEVNPSNSLNPCCTKNNAKEDKPVCTTSASPCSKELQSNGQCFRIMLMNIADDSKKMHLTKVIENLGGVVTADGSISSHVVTGKVRQTQNFCTALCSGAWIVSPNWLKESFRAGRFVDELSHVLYDEDYVLKYRTELKSAVLRARAKPGGLLRGYNISIAAHVRPPAKTLSAIVRSAGGNVVSRLENINEASKTIFFACEEDMEEALSAVKKGVWTFSSEWLMNCIMRQELDLEAPQFAESL